jgi:hypothetical protein
MAAVPSATPTSGPQSSSKSAMNATLAEPRINASSVDTAVRRMMRIIVKIACCRKRFGRCVMGRIVMGVRELRIWDMRNLIMSIIRRQAGEFRSKIDIYKIMKFLALLPLGYLFLLNYNDIVRTYKTMA